MRTITLDEAQSNLARLVEEAANGEPFAIASEGKPRVQVTAVEEAPEPPVSRRIGFMEGRMTVPEDFHELYSDEIERLFYGEV